MWKGKLTPAYSQYSNVVSNMCFLIVLSFLFSWFLGCFSSHSFSVVVII